MKQLSWKNLLWKTSSKLYRCVSAYLSYTEDWTTIAQINKSDLKITEQLNEWMTEQTHSTFNDLIKAKPYHTEGW